MSLPRDLASDIEAAGQEHLLAHASALDESDRARLAADLGAVDWSLVARLRQSLEQPPSPGATPELAPLPALRRGDDPARDREAQALGEQLLAEGRLAAFLVAGGQGSRLGHEGPKGTFPATPLRGKSLYQVFCEKLRARSRRHGRAIPLYVMTSPENHAATVRFLEDHQRFGLEPEQLRFLTQGTLPAVDEDGRVMLRTSTELFRSPDGHGGSLLALARSGALAEMAGRGVQMIFYFQVDNPLVDLLDPLFLGYHRLEGSSFSSKAVPKTDPGERVGVLVRRDGRPGVIEYSDLPAELRDAREDDGRLRYRAGNIAVHVLDRSFVEDLNRGSFQLPYHQARKSISAWDPRGGSLARPGVKFETFVFDALPLAPKALVLEVERAAEFSPIKNAAGTDSPDTSRADQAALFARWLEEAGVAVPRDAQGRPRFTCEISPLFADSAATVRERMGDLPEELDRDLVLEDS